jgi:hypothetical protein
MRCRPKKFQQPKAFSFQARAISCQLNYPKMPDNVKIVSELTAVRYWISAFLLRIAALSIRRRIDLYALRGNETA